MFDVGLLLLLHAAKASATNATPAARHGRFAVMTKTPQ
jgi:hypothetical protein